MAKRKIPELLNICLIGNKFQILSRATDQGFLWPIAKGLAKQGHKVTVISASSPIGKAEVHREDVTAYYLKENQKSSKYFNFPKAAYEKFLSLHQQEPFHLVHSLDDSGLQIGLNKKKNHVAMAYDVEATQMAQLFSILGMNKETLGSLLITSAALTYKFLTTYFGQDRKLLSTADGIFVTNPQQRVALERYYLFPDYHIYQVPYGADIGDLSPKEISIELKKSLGLMENSQIVVTISDMTDVREVKNLLLAFEKVAIKKPNAYFIIIGNGPMWREIEFEILNLALGNRVIMTGALKPNEIFDYILIGDIFINMSSKSTGFEPTSLEAMAQKKVVIGSEVSPMTYVVEDGKDGFLLRPADWMSLSQLILKVFTGEIQSEQIGENARSKVVNLFDTQKMIRAVLDAYRKILLNTGDYK